MNWCTICSNHSVYIKFQFILIIWEIGMSYTWVCYISHCVNIIIISYILWRLVINSMAWQGIPYNNITLTITISILIHIQLVVLLMSGSYIYFVINLKRICGNLSWINLDCLISLSFNIFITFIIIKPWIQPVLAMIVTIIFPLKII